MKTAAPPKIHSATEAARMLGLTNDDLIALIRTRRYQWTEMRPDGKPGDTGRNRWGLTDEQIAEIVRGQRRVSDPPQPDKPETPRPSVNSPDGVSRIRKVTKIGR